MWRYLIIRSYRESRPGDYNNDQIWTHEKNPYQKSHFYSVYEDSTYEILITRAMDGSWLWESKTRFYKIDFYQMLEPDGGFVLVYSLKNPYD